MTALSPFFVQALAAISYFKYPIIFLGTIVEGPILMVASGFLYRLGYLELIPLYLTLLMGDFAADLMWYFAGYHYAHPFMQRFGKFFGITEALFEKIREKFHEHQGKILLISKVTMGLGFGLATLLVAGAVRVPFKRYALYTLTGGFLWVLIPLGLGYGFGNFYETIAMDFRILSLVVMLALVAALLYGWSRYVRKEIFTKL